ncbi:MAG: DUF3604 domain-containing protein [Gammaproteobacteria bacterium]|nr:DUF3604 domain-containing protein [Gammaproteobacteria bacterium]
MKNIFFTSLALISCFIGSAESISYLLEDREPCSIYAEEKMPLFGDLHVHTALSLDANTQGTLNTPDDAYRYAQGQSLFLQPYNSDGTSSRISKLKQPLDFAAVTDHAELLGEVRMCLDSMSFNFNGLQCKVYRNFPKLSYFYMNAKASLRKPMGMCGDSREACLDAAQAPWQETIQAAEDHYDRSEDCSFTTFVGYEWTGAAYSGNNLHRNIIFENSNVPFQPISFYEAPSREMLWTQLDNNCSSDCDYMVIPHNSNLSNGYMFEKPSQDEIYLQNTKEPLVEIFQHKGSSECAIDPKDPMCNFEQLPYKDFKSKFRKNLSNSPKSSFARDALNQGLLMKEEQGINPFKLGFIGSTDTHLGTPGSVDEEFFQGHGGAGKSFRTSIPEGLPDDIEFNPGGLAVVWAEENSRTSIFNALQRKEVYGTSGPRFLVRFFLGDDFSENLCDQPNAIASSYKNGAPMGGTLNSKQMSKARIFVSATADASIKNQFIEKLQVIKGVIRNGEIETSVHDIKTHPPADLDFESCNVIGSGVRSMCSVWEDPDFNNTEDAYYYVRVIANKSCRWSHDLCLKNPSYCEDSSESSVPKFIQERAWTSPIWLENS